MSRTAMAGALLVGAALLLSGCGAASHLAANVAGAARKTAGLSWVRYQIRFTSSDLFSGKLAVIGARGAYDFRTGLDYAFINVHEHGGRSQNVFVDSSQTELAVAPSPAPAGLLPARKAWISTPLDGNGAGGTLAAQAEGLAPRLAVDEIKWGVANASSLGTHAVGHVPLDEYRVSVDLAKARSAATKHGDTGVAAAIGQELRSSPSGRVAIDAWVNGPGYLAQISEHVPGLGGTALSFTSYTQKYTGAFASPSESVSLASLRPGSRSLWLLATGS